MTLEPILQTMIEASASDLYLVEGCSPMLRVEGVTRAVDGALPLSGSDLDALLGEALNEAQRREFTLARELNLSLARSGLGRFRVNCYRTLGAVGMVIRRVRGEIPTLEGLGLPAILKDLALERQGLVLVVGATGVGKSTTLGAMIEHRNAHLPGHIITIEDPIEFLHAHKQSVISQREVGIDTVSYDAALANALRQAPDVILIGELRETTTVAVALHAAETGHLVLSTLHATNAGQAVERLIHFFPPEGQQAVLLQISMALKAIIAQRLVPGADGKGLVAAVEIMLVTPRIQALVRRGELEGLRTAIEEGIQEGLQTFDQALFALYREGKVTAEEAVRFADSPNNLRLRIKGIR